MIECGRTLLRFLMSTVQSAESAATPTTVAPAFELTVYVKTLWMKTHTFQCSRETTVGQLKQMVAARDQQCDAVYSVVSYQGRRVRAPQTLGSVCGAESDPTFHMMWWDSPPVRDE